MSLSLQISVPKDKFSPGESIPVNMILKNESGKTMVIDEFTFNSDLTEMLVFDSEDKLVACLDDYVRQELLGLMPPETMTHLLIHWVLSRKENEFGMLASILD